jgi:Zn-dependent M28 family amino/carboxypeptidase
MKLLRSLLRIAVVLLLILGGAALLVRQPVFTSLPDRLRNHADPAALRRHVEFLCNQASPRDSDHPENLDRAARYLTAALARSGARVSEQAYEARGKTYRNVIARLGPDGAHPLVVGAHYDSFGDFGLNPGADDNASGASALPEIARLLSGLPLRQPVELVAYSTEEPPYFASEHMGSAVHARSLRREGRAPTGMICLEMIGTYKERQPWPSALLRWLYPGDGRFLAVAGRFEDRHLARQFKRGFRGAGTLRAVSYTGPEIPGFDASDHRSYWAEGFQAIVVTDTAFLRNPNYHTPDDRPETLDYRRMAQAVDGIANAVIGMAGERQ